MENRFQYVKVARFDESYKFTALVNTPNVHTAVEGHKISVPSSTPIDQIEQLAIRKAREHEEELKKEAGR